MPVTRNMPGLPFHPSFHAPFRSGPGQSRRGLVLLTVLVFAWMLSFGVAAEAFKWVDDRGKVHYGDSPPHDRDVEAIRVPHPSPGSKALGSGVSQAGLRDLQRATESDKKRKEEKQAATSEKEKRSTRCLEAQRLLPILQLNRPVYRLDEKGNRVFLDDDERAAEIARLQEVVKMDCR